MMTLSKNWTSRKAVISAYHISYLQELAEQTGIDSLSDAVNHLIAEYRKSQHPKNNSVTAAGTVADINIEDDDDFGLNDNLM